MSTTYFKDEEIPWIIVDNNITENKIKIIKSKYPNADIILKKDSSFFDESVALFGRMTDLTDEELQKHDKTVRESFRKGINFTIDELECN